MTDTVKRKIIYWFLSGQSINHIVYLLDYNFNITVVSHVIRERFNLLESQVALPEVQALLHPTTDDEIEELASHQVTGNCPT